ncbi:MAG: hypothetical protein Q9222_006167 [Ikaeria aurantiellina]
MNTSGVMSPPSILVHDMNSMNGPRRPSSGTAAKSISRSPGPMAVPNAGACEPFAPPPLPPPRHIEDLAAGSDPGWRWGNASNHGGFGGNSVNSNSSFSSSHGNWGRRMEDEGLPAHSASLRRDSPFTASKPFPGMDMNAIRLHGERHLEQRNVETASQAYDNKLLSKIGKPKTPPHVLRTSSVDAASPTSSLSSSSTSYYQDGRHPHQLKSLSISESTTGSYPRSPFKREPLSSRSAESPQSRALSPSLLSSAASAKSFMDWRSPTWEGGTPTSATSAVSDPQLHSFSRSQSHSQSQQSSRYGSFSSQYQQQRQQQYQQPPSHRRRSVFSSYDESAAGSLVSEGASRGSKRGSQDQSTISESDSTSDFPYMEETGAMRHLHLEDRAPLSLDPALQQYSSSPIIPSESRLGMKRRASSPPPDSSHDDKAPLHSAGSSGDLYQRNAAAAAVAAAANAAANAAAHPPNRASPVNRFGPQHGSVSSASSTGLRNGSYASSGGLSVGSSLTSLSPNYERLSPTSEYPYPQSHPERDSPYITSHPSPQSSLSHSHPRPPSEKPSGPASHKMSSETSAPRTKKTPPNLQAAPNICRCCPKKPKKFETLEELRAHESEKNYACNYCSNRFKNKNEAERHQNSLHVRRHSWSCATLANNYERVFHPSTAIPAQHPSQPPPPSEAVAAADVCGYCGMEFTNEPQPDWNERISHLTNVHKFGECNQSKKFFRADHFRQHLKHSHAGTSGKWTNMLEGECMKEEPVPEMMPQPSPMQQSMSMQQQPIHQMQGLQPGPSMQQGLGGAPIANMGVMSGMPGRPGNMMGPSSLSNETIDE